MRGDLRPLFFRSGVFRPLIIDKFSRETAMLFPVKPVAKPRMTRSDKWAKRQCVEKYYSFKDRINMYGKGYELPSSFRVVFGIPFGKTVSMAKRDRLVGTPHQVKPDVDNLLKALMDALKDRDQDVWHVDAKKIWTNGEGFINIEEIYEND